MPNQITYGDPCRQAILRGVNSLANAVKVTLGPKTGQYEDLVRAGVIDPAKVVRSALQNAASVAGLLITTEAVISQIPDAHTHAMSLGGM